MHALDLYVRVMLYTKCLLYVHVCTRIQSIIQGGMPHLSIKIFGRWTDFVVLRMREYQARDWLRKRFCFANVTSEI